MTRLIGLLASRRGTLSYAIQACGGARDRATSVKLHLHRGDTGFLGGCRNVYRELADQSRDNHFTIEYVREKP